MKKKTVLFFAGHSGGHLYPALSVAEEFRKRHPDYRLELVSSPKGRGIFQLPAFKVFDGFHTLISFPLPRGISFRSLIFLLKFALASIQSALLLIWFRPCLALGFGSYVSYPGIMLAVFWKIPAWIHEQNCVPGKATLALALHVDVAALSFPLVERLPAKRCIEIGLPIRKQLVQAASQSGERTFPASFSIERPLKILIVGGSQGASGINFKILDTFFQFSAGEKRQLAVTHSTGQADEEKVREEYKKMGISAEVMAFSKNMDELYTNCDLSIGRGGANTLAELGLFGVPGIIVPYPHADSHQEKNARYFEKRQAVICRTEKDIEANKELLANDIRMFLNNPSRLSAMSVHAKQSFLSNAASHFVNEIEKAGILNSDGRSH